MTDQTPTIADPLLRRLHAYWLQKKGDRIAPRRADIAPEEIPGLIPWVFLIEVVGERFRVRLVGTAIAREYGGELTGLYVDEVDLDSITALALEEYRRSAREVVPIASTWSYRKNDGRYLEYERVILPLSTDGKTVDMFICGAVGRGFG